MEINLCSQTVSVMSYQVIKKIDTNKLVILDGAMGSELEKRSTNG